MSDTAESLPVSASASAADRNPDAEDLMAAALSELRQERAAGGDEVAVAPVASRVDAPAQGGVSANAHGPASFDGTSPAAGPNEQAQGTAPAAPAAGDADPAEALRQTQLLLQQARSELGRVGHLNRHLHEARAQRDRLAQENAALLARQRAVPSPEQQLSDDAAAKLAALAEQVRGYPELEGLVSAVGDALTAGQARAEATARRTVESAVAPLQGLRAEHAQREQEQRAAAHEAAMQAFHTTYPNAVEVVRSAEFNAWIHTQPQPIQTAFYQGQEPGEAIAVMDAYDAHLRRAGRAPIAHYPAVPTVPAQPQYQPPAAQRASANAARLQSAAGLPSRAGGARGGLPPEDDFEASLDYFRRQRLGA